MACRDWCGIHSESIKHSYLARELSKNGPGIAISDGAAKDFKMHLFDGGFINFYPCRVATEYFLSPSVGKEPIDTRIGRTFLMCGWLVSKYLPKNPTPPQLKYFCYCYTR
jgi:hypothetical protein